LPDRLFWGDLHNHNSVGLFHYSKGSLERTLEIARSHLDFCAFTGHAHWHDMPEMVANAHEKWAEGFAHHTEQWPKTCELVAEANMPPHFVAFLGYEWHSAKYGDRSVLYPYDNGELCRTDDVQELYEHARTSGALLIPHHIGYKRGLPGRGLNWDAYDETVCPLVEIYSEHGGTERDRGPWSYLRHSNGPRTTHHTMQHGLEHGHHFGVTASTDDHFGYPGAYGEGLVGVYAAERTRESIWEALLARRVYAVTGDRIELSFSINDAPMGSILDSADDRHIQVAVRGWDEVASIEVLRNNRVVHRHFPEDHHEPAGNGSRIWKCRLEFGWGPWTAFGMPRVADWKMLFRVEGARIADVMPCFQSGPFDEDRRNRILERDETMCRWESYTSRQDAFDETPTNAVVFELEGPPEATVHIEVDEPGERRIDLSLEQLADSSHIEFTGEFPCESLLVHRLVPEGRYQASFDFDDGPSGVRDEDFYYIRVTQANGQMAWSSPIWVGGSRA
jgi:hypothetical protein